MELFTTSLRATGHTSCVVVGRIGAILSTFWVDSFVPNYPLVGRLVIAFALMVATIGVCFLEETSGNNLDSSSKTMNKTNLDTRKFTDKVIEEEKQNLLAI